MDKKLFLFILMSLLISYANATDVTECQTISSDGSYVMTQDIDNSSGSCFTILTDNVIFDCNYYNVTLIGNNSVFVSDSYDNITIKNCNMHHNESDSGWIRGVYIVNGNTITVTNSSFHSNYGCLAGFEIRNFTDVNVSYNLLNEFGSISLWNINDSVIHDNFVNNSGSNNSPCIALTTDYAGEYAYNSSIYNNNLVSTGTYSDATEIRRTNNVKVLNNTCSATGSYGISLISVNDSYVLDNNVTSNMRALFIYWDDDFGIKTKNTTIRNNFLNSIITGSGKGVVLSYVDEIYLINNTINAYSYPENNTQGIYIIEIENSNISYNNVFTDSESGGYGIVLRQWHTDNRQNANNWIGYNNVNVTGYWSNHILIDEYDTSYGVGQNNTFISNVLIGDQTGGMGQFELYGNNNGTRIIDMVIGEYIIGNETFYGYPYLVSYISIENSTFGKINYTFGVEATGIGRKLYEDLIFGNASVWINSSSGLNQPANVTFYNVGDRGFIIPVILKDGLPCEDCVNYTDLNAETVLFSVTGFSNYSIGDEYVSSEIFGFDIVSVTGIFVGTLTLFLPVILILGFVFVFRDEFSKILKFPKL